jgi:hypothetical protein
MSTNERRRSEPEIIPPGHDIRKSGAGRTSMRVFVDGNITRHVIVARLGPLGALLVALIIATACAMILILFLSVFLIWIPLLGLLVAAVIISGVLRHFRRQH